MSEFFSFILILLLSHFPYFLTSIHFFILLNLIVCRYMFFINSLLLPRFSSSSSISSFYFPPYFLIFLFQSFHFQFLPPLTYVCVHLYVYSSCRFFFTYCKNIYPQIPRYDFFSDSNISVQYMSLCYVVVWKTKMHGK